MATNISGSVSLTYGTHSHSESFSTTTAALTDANPFNEYAAGSGRAVLTPAALKVGNLTGGNEGLLLIKNDSNFSDLSLDVGTDDGSGDYNIVIPAGLANLISVGPDHAVFVKCNIADTAAGIDSVAASGAIVFDGSGAPSGTAIMTASTAGDYADDLVVEIPTTLTTGTAYELDGVTKKDLLTGTGTTAGYDASTTVDLAYFAQYRYTLTEA